MIDRGTILRGFVALVLLAAMCASAYVAFSDPDGTSGRFLEDERGEWAYGPIYEQPGAWRNTVLADSWVDSIPVRGGTFGGTFNRLVRVSMDGTGPIPTREVTLDTPAAVRLFERPRRARAEGVLHGIQRILEERGGVVRGLSLAETEGGAQAAVIASIVREHVVEDIDPGAEQRVVTGILRSISADISRHAFAWYDPHFEDVVLGPEISKGLLRWIRTPGRATPEQNVFTAYVLRHELEHAITPIGDDYREVQWIEEGSADTLARWAGAAAATARELGMPYPKRYDEREYRTKRGGYPEWTDALRVLLAAAGADWRRPGDLAEATELLQGEDAGHAAQRIAERIAQRERLTARQRVALQRAITRLDGDPVAARRLVARY